MFRTLKTFLLASLATISFTEANACTPYGVPTVAGVVVGTDLQITVTTNTSWGCTYHYEVEIACLAGAYTGVPTFAAPASGTASGAGSNYATQTIDISGYCPGNYKLRVREKTTYYGAGGPWSPYSADFNFTVPGAVLTVVADASPLSICFPGSSDLSATPSSACGTITYTWDNGGGPGQNVTVSPTGTTTYTVTAYDPLSCVTATSSVTVTAAPAAVAGVAAAAPLSICDGDNITLSLAGETGTIQWQSSPSSGGPWTDIGGATTNSEVIGPLSPGDDLFFQAVVTSCGTEISNEVTVTVNPLPVITAPADFEVCEGTAVTITGVGAVGYAWTGGVVDGVPFTPPVGVTTYTVTGTDINGCQGTDDVDITVNALPIIDAGADQTVCDDGTNVTLSGAGGVSYVWTGGITDGLAFLPSLGTTTYTVTGTDANGCENTDVVDVTVDPLDDPSFNYPAGLSHCISGVDVIAAITGLTGGTFSYVVTSGGPTLDINPATGDITMASSTTGTFDITYSTVGAPGSLCPQTSTVSLTIADAPIADFFIDDFCANLGDPVPTYVGGGAAGVFSSTPGLVINAVTGEVDLDASTPGLYTVTNTISVPGCAVVVFTDDMEIFDVPTATISGGATICSGTALPDLTIDIVGGTGPFSVDYDLDGAPQPALAIPGASSTIPGAAVGTYDLTVVTDANGCVGTLASTTIVNEFPTPVMDPVTDYEVCAEDNLSILAFGSSLVGDSYTWTNTGTDVGFGAAGLGTIGSFTGVNPGTVDVTTTIDVFPTSVDGCIGLPTSFDVTIHPLPSPGLMPDVTQGCEPLLVNFTEDASVPPPSASCLWDFGDGTTATGCGSVSHSYENAGTYDVTITTTTVDGCTATVTENNLIVVTALPVAEFTYHPQVITIEDTEVNFDNLSFNADEYEWDFADSSPLNTEFSPTHNFPEEPGEYLVTLTAMNNGGVCRSVFQQLVIVDDVIIFYVPNIFTPDGDEYNEVWKPIFYSGYDPYDYHLTLYNRWGEVVFESFDANYGWDGHYGTQGLVEDGTYIWQIDFKETMSDKKHKHKGHVTILK